MLDTVQCSVGFLFYGVPLEVGRESPRYRSEMGGCSLKVDHRDRNYEIWPRSVSSVVADDYALVFGVGYD